MPIDDLVKAPNFRINLFAVVPGATSLANGPDGLVHVATSRGEIVRVADRDRDGTAEEAARTGVQLEPPVALTSTGSGATYAFGRDRVVRLDTPGETADRVTLPPGVVQPPRAGGQRHIAAGPDERLYLSLGASCDGCRSRQLAGSIVGMRPDGHELATYVRSAQDPGALDWHPSSGRLTFTDQAPGPLAVERQITGLFQVGARSIEPDGPADPIAFEEAAWLEPVPELAWTFAPGLAPAGIDFYGGDSFPRRFHHALLVTLNPIESAGPPSEVVALRFDRDGRPEGEEVLLAGWRERNGTAWGRPVDVEELDDGSILIADEVAGVIYRLAYRP
ncbi:MAG: hypothetical protein R3349_03440 [Geminicoccaceae bacterium]|nr:hypothetical protein [Geminicoccaceae bacterium]